MRPGLLPGPGGEDLLHALGDVRVTAAACLRRAESASSRTPAQVRLESLATQLGDG
jgi:hypothetical protein